MTDVFSTEQLLDGLVKEASANSARSLWAQDRKLGVSDIGTCREYVRLMIADEEWSDPQEEYMPAFMGTAFGRELEEAYKKRYPEAMTQLSVNVRLPLGGFEIRLPGHPDIVHQNRVIDLKTKNGLSVIRKMGCERKHQYQVTLYAKALIDDGIIDEDAVLALAYYDRSGAEEQPHVYEWTYDPTILEEALEWFSDVAYAYANGEEASKDKPREWCWSYCPYATKCRGMDTDVTGLIEDEEIVTAANLYKEAQATIREAERVKKAAAATLANIAGNTEDWSIRWITVGPAEIPAQVRQGYSRIDIRARKK